MIYTVSIEISCAFSRRIAETYRRDTNAVCACSQDGYIFAAMAVERFSEGRNGGRLVYCDRFRGPGWCEGHAGGGGCEGARLDWTLS